MAGTPMTTIADIVGCAPQTVKNDIEDVQQAVAERDALRAGDVRDQAVEDRRHLKKLALNDREEAEAKDRAPLLKEARHNQTGIEELQDLHPKEPAVIGVGPTFIQIGEGPPEDPAELTREERAERRRIIDAELKVLPEPAEEAAESPPDSSS